MVASTAASRGAARTRAAARAADAAGAAARSAPDEPSVWERARERLRGTGERVTTARVKVLAALMQANEALAHPDVQQRIAGGPVEIDRVTVYRVLDWLVEQGLAHRVSGPDRVWRFSAHAHRAHAHGHFKCRRCERMFCMREPGSLNRALRAMLPDGFEGDEIELTVMGVCADCGARKDGDSA